MNREKKWTQGPWYTYLLKNGEVQTISTMESQAVDDEICDDFGSRDEEPPDNSVAGIWSTTDESKANAALISAAPELFEALEFQCLRCRADIAKHNALSEDKQDADCGDCVCGRALTKAYGETV